MTKGFLKPELNKLNEEHYPDPTAYQAFSHEKENLRRELDLAKLSVAMAEVKLILRRHGFFLTERIKVKSRKTGMIYE